MGFCTQFLEMLELKTQMLFAFAHKQMSLDLLILGVYIVEELFNNLAKIY